MRNLRVHVGPEAVLVTLDVLPEALWPLGGELEAHDRLHVLEAVLPRRRQAQGRAVLLHDRLAVEAGSDEGELMACLRHGEALDVGPRSEEHTSELQSLMRNSYAVFCLKKKIK